MPPKVIEDKELHRAMDLILATIRKHKIDDFIAVSAMKMMCISFERVNGFTILIQEKETETVH